MVKKKRSVRGKALKQEYSWYTEETDISQSGYRLVTEDKRFRGCRWRKARPDDVGFIGLMSKFEFLQKIFLWA